MDRIIAAGSTDELFLKSLVESMDNYAALEHEHAVTIVEVLGTDGVKISVNFVGEDDDPFLATILARGKFDGHNMVEVFVGDDSANAVMINAVPKMVLAVLLEW